MPNLIERIQAGPGSRELSDEFLLARGYRKEQPSAWSDPVGVWFSPNPENIYPFRLNPTLNTDDALAMVPEGWLIEEISDYHAAGWYCSLARNLNFSTMAQANGPTLPLAICAAILGIE